MMKLNKIAFVLGIICSFSSCNRDTMDNVDQNEYLPPLPVDLPETERVDSRNALLVEITEEGFYYFEKDIDSTAFTDFTDSLRIKIKNKNTDLLKIGADRKVSYDYVFRVIEICKTEGLNPILLFN